MTFTPDASARISRYCADGKPAIILHFADHDPSGIDMSRDLRDRLGNVEVRRVALTFEQVQHYNLIPNPAKMADTRANGYVSQYGSQCWELDAIPPDELVRLCGDAVASLISNPDAWQAIKERDATDRNHMLKQLNLWEAR